jgi:hypothetical protein
MFLMFHLFLKFHWTQRFLKNPKNQKFLTIR